MKRKTLFLLIVSTNFNFCGKEKPNKSLNPSKNQSTDDTKKSPIEAASSNKSMHEFAFLTIDEALVDAKGDSSILFQTGEATKKLTLRNIGQKEASSIKTIGIEYSEFISTYFFLGGMFPGTGGTCTTTLAANDSCTLQLGYSKSSTGKISNLMSTSYFDGSEDSIPQYLEITLKE